MRHSGKLLPILILCLMLVCQSALAGSITFSGTVSAADTYEVYAPIGGTVETVSVKTGEAVTEDTVLCSLKTTGVYAPADGTVTGIFAQPGDSADTVCNRYGAVLFLEEEARYTVSASTEYAYNSTENQYVHAGEHVYLKSRSTSSRTGEGTITAISGISFTVEITQGDFLLGESLEVFRSADYASTSRIGRGSTSRKEPTGITGTGSIVSVAVADGATVSRGDLLFETLEGTFDGMYMTGTSFYAGKAGTVGKINVEQGANVQKGSVIAVLYPAGSMRIEGSVDESKLGQIAVGDKAEITLQWNSDDDVTYEGIITGISAIADSSQSAAGGETEETAVTYTVYVSFTPDENTRFGMTASVSTAAAGEDEEAEEYEAEDAENR